MVSLTQLAVIGLESLLPETQKKISLLVDTANFLPKRPQDQMSLIQCIGDSDAILISPHIHIDAEVMSKCQKLKYIGVYGKSLHNVDLDLAKSKNIIVKNNEVQSTLETAEFCLAVLLQVARGLSPLKLNQYSISLKGKTLGLIGFGPIGQAFAKLAESIGMNVIYSSRTRKPGFENSQIVYVELDELLQKSDVISLHTHPKQLCLAKDSFFKMQRCFLLINTSYSAVMDKSAFVTWLSEGGHFAVFDDVAALDYRLEIEGLPNVYFPQKSAWRTLESIRRKDENLLRNFKIYLGC